MPDLIAQGANAEDRWRRSLVPGEVWILGRAAGGWSVGWDDWISRRHAELCWDGVRLRVRRLAEARNPLFFRGVDCERLELVPGEHFVVGKTTFMLVEEPVQLLPELDSPTSERHFAAHDLHGLRFRNADERIEVLNRLPEIIRGAANDRELHFRFVNVLLAGLPRARFAALVDTHRGAGTAAPVQILYWDGRPGSGPFQPSEALIQKAVETQASVVQEWEQPTLPDEEGTEQSLHWALCSPLRVESCRGWAVYVAGQERAAAKAIPALRSGVREDVKFAEIAASLLGSLCELRRLERRHSALHQFFSPLVLEALAGDDPEQVLAPQLTEVAVLFCDLRGFSRKSEREAHDLMGLLERVSGALRVMTRHIFAQGGVVGDFHGDSAMGFWGWPLPQPDAVLRACAAALSIRAEFERAALSPTDPLSGFDMGIGLASGPAVAGKIGAVDQVKVTAFGPVVNLAARLQELTKVLRAPILLDEVTAAAVRGLADRHSLRLRRVARVQPYGLQTPLVLSELLPAASPLSDGHLRAYEAALDAVLEHRWGEAFRLLHEVPAEDRVKDLLTVFIAQHNRVPPENWDGVIPLPPRSDVGRWTSTP